MIEPVPVRGKAHDRAHECKGPGECMAPLMKEEWVTLRQVIISTPGSYSSRLRSYSCESLGKSDQRERGWITKRVRFVPTSEKQIR